MFNTLKVEASKGDIIAVNEAVKMLKLLQIVCGVAYDNDGNEVTIDAKPRLNAVKEVVDDAGSKVIVFVPFVSAVKLLSAFLTDSKIGNEMIYGGVSKSSRDRIFHEFQTDPTLRVLVAQPAAMSHGLTLTEASTVVWYAPIVSNDIFEQANGRITRPGQTQKQFIVMLEGAPVERRIYARLRNKQKVQGVLLDLVKCSR
jgi:SNF2 family DNA or RNA helicase